MVENKNDRTSANIEDNGEVESFDAKPACLFKKFGRIYHKHMILSIELVKIGDVYLLQ